MIIIWTLTAKFRLKEIYLYYKHAASLPVAKKLKKEVFTSTSSLKNHPEIGQIEELLKNKKFEYRYLIKGNYKIIYRIENDRVYVIDVFDCRQNPTKLSKVRFKR